MISVIVPSKNERYLNKTMEDIKEHAEGEIEILTREGMGQREAMNDMVREARGEYILKTDAHCSFGQGFDLIMLEDLKEDMIMAPYLLPLDAEKWIVSHHNKMANYEFDTNLVMHHAPTRERLVVETMCLQGSCFLLSKENYLKWDVCDESLGSWGHQGVELGIQAWRHGGKCVTTKKTYYGHLFRHKESEFPYKRNKEGIDATHTKFKEKFLTRDIAGLVEKYDYPLDWTPQVVENMV